MRAPDRGWAGMNQDRGTGIHGALAAQQQLTEDARFAQQVSQGEQTAALGQAR